MLCRKPDCQSQEPGFESPFAAVSKRWNFRYIHDAPVHSSSINEYLTRNCGENMCTNSLRTVIAASSINEYLTRNCGENMCMDSLRTVIAASSINEYLTRNCGENMCTNSLRTVIAAWLIKCFPEKSSWCRNELVCQRGRRAL